MSIPNRAHLEIAKAFVRRWSELTIAEIEADIEKLDVASEPDGWEGWAVRAYWQRQIDFLLSIHKVNPRPESDQEELRLFERVFGHYLDLPADRLADDVAERLDRAKRAAARRLEMEIRDAVNTHSVISPIEHLFLIEWKLNRIEEMLGVRFTPQKQCDTDRGMFVLDFLIAFDGPNAETFRLGIELDGHDFHEKSKEQVESDKVRERAIVRAGIVVFRFSGSEVYRNAGKCVQEVAEYIRSRKEGTGEAVF